MRNRTKVYARFTSGTCAVIMACSCTNPADIEQLSNIGSRQTALLAENGLVTNVLGYNVLGYNVLGYNVLGYNNLGIHSDGTSVLTVNAVGLNGIGSAGAGTHGMGLNASGLNGLYINQIGKHGVALDGTGANSVAQSGGSNGIVISGVAMTSTSVPGTDDAVIEGLGMEGVSVNGAYIRGIHENVAAVDGIALGDVALDGLHINGPGGIQRINHNGIAVDLNSAQEANLDIALQHLVACALPSGDAVTITTAGGTPTTYHGLRGFAPEWKTEALSAAGAERVRTCLETSTQATLGLALSKNQEANLLTVLEYMVGCALPAGESATIYTGNGGTETYYGILGLAPEWRDGPLSASGERWISACLAARTNALQQRVLISLRPAGTAPDPFEAALFSNHEGVFWSDLFADEPYIRACVAQGGGLTGRTCAQSDECGFTFMGDCDDICDYDAATGLYSACEGETNVINTFLNLGRGISFGGQNGCKLRDSDGSLFCWGNNQHGQLGDGTTTASDYPVQTSVIGAEVAEAVIHDHGCARKLDGSVWCWGKNTWGQVGLGIRDKDNNNPETRPVQITELGHDVARITVGAEHSCALKTNGSVQCWGRRVNGNGGTVAEPSPIAVPGFESDVVKISSATFASHSCGIKTDGTLWCFGDNDQGQIGNGTKHDQVTPAQVIYKHGTAYSDATDVCTSKKRTCARKSDGTLDCWGGGAKWPKAVALPSGRTVAPGGLSCGRDHACVVMDNATVFCLGDNTQQQLGRDTPGTFAGELGQVPGLPSISFVQAAKAHTCAMDIEGSFWCWGTNAKWNFTQTPQAIDITLPAQ